MAGPPNAILAINSLDRYNTQTNPTLATSLEDQYENIGPPSNNFTLQSGGAFVYGYMDKIVVSQVQLQYNVPTVIPNKNDTFIIVLETPVQEVITINIPWGFYSPEELAAIIQVKILQTDIAIYAPNFSVTYQTDGIRGGFKFLDPAESITFYFPTLSQLRIIVPNYSPDTPVDTVLKTYRLLGMTENNSNADYEQLSTISINWLYTPYVDIISEVLTKYQNIKDTDSSYNKLNSIIARIYLNGVGIPQTLEANVTLGSAPFTIVQDLNTPKIMRWSPEESVYNIDFALRDQYGDLLFYQGTDSENNLSQIYNTEFQITLLCSEKKNR
jgi:hypothetical protein